MQVSQLAWGKVITLPMWRRRPCGAGVSPAMIPVWRRRLARHVHHPVWRGRLARD